MNVYDYLRYLAQQIGKTETSLAALYSGLYAVTQPTFEDLTPEQLKRLLTKLEEVTTHDTQPF